MALESVRVPEVGESVTEGTIATWFAEPGSAVVVGDPLFELATEKVDSEIPSPVSGTVVEILIPKGGAVSVGDAVITIDTGAEAPSEVSAPLPTDAPAVEATPASDEQPARKLRRSKRQAAAAMGADAPPLPPMPPGTDPEPRVTMADTVEPGDGDSFRPFSRIRAVTGRIVADANVTIPHALSMVEADHTAVLQARAVVASRNAGPPPTALAFVAVAVARALGEHPVLNASIGDGGLVLHGDINLAFAVATDDGLVAPVVHHANQLTVTGMAEAIVDLARRARTKKLAPDDMTGGTFSISNNGSVGSVLTAAIITPPQVAVLSTDKVVDRATVLERDGIKSIAIRPIGNLAMSWDHRAMDGADAAQFLSRVKEIIETTDWSALV